MDQRWYQSVPRWVYWWMPMDAVSLARETRGSAWQHRGDFQQLEHQAVKRYPTSKKPPYVCAMCLSHHAGH